MSVSGAEFVALVGGTIGACALAAAATWLVWRSPSVTDRDERAFRACRKALALDEDAERILRAMAEALRATNPEATPVALLLSRAAFIEAAKAHRRRRGWRDDAAIERLLTTLHERADAPTNKQHPAKVGARPFVLS